MNSSFRLSFILCCVCFLSTQTFRVDAILPYDDPGPLGMQLISLLSSVKSALESYCPMGDHRPLCTELRLMDSRLKQFQAGKPVEGMGSFTELRSREQAIEAELQRQQWDREIEEVVR